MSHNQQLLLAFLHAALAVATYIPVAILTFMALRSALRRKQKSILSWLLPLGVSHALGSIYYLYELSFYVFHWKASVISILSIYGLSAFAFMLALYTSWRTFHYVTTLPMEALTQPEGVWPPPPTQKDRTNF